MESRSLDWLESEFASLSKQRWDRNGPGITVGEYERAQAIKAAILAKVLT